MNRLLPTHSKHPGFYIGYILLIIILFFVFSLGFFPLIFFLRIVFLNFTPTMLWHWLLLPFLVYIGLAILLISEVLVSGGIIKLAKVYYQPGIHEYSFKNSNSFKWILTCSLYTPFRKIMEIIPVGGLKNYYYKLLGMKIGKNTLVGGVIKDPCVTSFGNSTTMGEYAIIYGHIQDYSKGTLTVRAVSVGNNCVIGAGAIIMPGATIEDDVIIAAGAVVTQNQVLSQGKTYGGIPARELAVMKHNNP